MLRTRHSLCLTTRRSLPHAKLSLTSIRYKSSNHPKVELNQLDAKWTAKWREWSPTGSLHPTKHIVEKDATPFYALSMFPYPSGMLHMGHVRVYTISDVISRFKRLNGYDVTHPMGWDAFGLPAENAAFERKINPATWTESNIKKMKDQMNLMLADFDWDREVTTCSPDYYKWTQKIFLLLYENGLAYRKDAEINWDPVDMTVLANEQVDSEGRSWRSGAIVEKKNLEQWFIGITKYAKELNGDLESLDQWPDKVKAMQRHWIGESKGAEIVFPIRGKEEVEVSGGNEKVSGGNKEVSVDHKDVSRESYKELSVFTSRPDTLFSVQFLSLALNHPLVQKLALKDGNLQKFIKDSENADPDSKDGYLLDIKASIPITIQNTTNDIYSVPIYVAPYVLGNYGSGAVMGCPAHDIRDFEFWKIHNPSVQIIHTVGPPDENKVKDEDFNKPFTSKEGRLYDGNVLPTGLSNLGIYSGKTVKEAGKLVVDSLENVNLGSTKTQYRLRDWLISRQRYWGAPIPIIHCKDCGPVAVPDEDLPVLLPKIEGDNFEKGNPLSKMDEFINTKCPSCGSDARRDTDTMDTFMDSSWYFFRYVDPKNETLPFSFEKATKHLPVDMYIGGVEHAILHLLYSRFISKFLGDIGMWDGKKNFNEPIKQLVTQGMVHGKTFSDPVNGRCLKPEEMDLSNPQEPKVLATGKVPRITFEKMSKSKYNGADPAECIKKYGADATRAHMLFQAPINDVLNWNEEQILGICRWLHKVVSLENAVVERVEIERNIIETTNTEQVHSNSPNPLSPVNINLNGESSKSFKKSSKSFNQDEFQLHNEVLKYVQNISRSIEKDLSFNTIISDMMKLTNTIISSSKLNSIHHDLLLDSYKKLLIVMSPVTPCISEECWERLALDLGGPHESIFHQKYPQVLILESPQTTYKVFVNGKMRTLFVGDKSLIELSESDIIKEILKHGKTLSLMALDKVKKMILKQGMISIII